jgi:hypothetical protein
MVTRLFQPGHDLCRSPGELVVRVSRGNPAEDGRFGLTWHEHCHFTSSASSPYSILSVSILSRVLPELCDTLFARARVTFPPFDQHWL